ncbi:hypothetical protein I79_000919 [Cricetulus griseus]|uniref:Uncharacterized protein n=1 Tax=Cricetulus griseus TaxID=10029 RepID=G3GTE1_CRIGR|nr:hypothetical protein I79_000919 [Cricetulus griseus]
MSRVTEYSQEGRISAHSHAHLPRTRTTLGSWFRVLGTDCVTAEATTVSAVSLKVAVAFGKAGPLGNEGRSGPA